MLFNPPGFASSLLSPGFRVVVIASLAVVAGESVCYVTVKGLLLYSVNDFAEA